MSYTCVQAAGLLGSRQLPDAKYDVAFILMMKLSMMIVIPALDTYKP